VATPGDRRAEALRTSGDEYAMIGERTCSLHVSTIPETAGAVACMGDGRRANVALRVPLAAAP
jgi:hypothetical protein